MVLTEYGHLKGVIRQPFRQISKTGIQHLSRYLIMVSLTGMEWSDMSQGQNS